MIDDALVEEVRDYMRRLYTEASREIATGIAHDTWYGVATTLEKLVNCTVLQSLKDDFTRIRSGRYPN